MQRNQGAVAAESQDPDTVEGDRKRETDGDRGDQAPQLGQPRSAGRSKAEQSSQFETDSGLSDQEHGDDERERVLPLS